MSQNYSRLLAVALLGSVAFAAGCPAGGEVAQIADLALPPPPPDGATTVGMFEDCTPSGFSDVVCKKGLRCGLVNVGDPPYQGSLAQCVPVSDKPLALDDVCQFDQGGMTPVGGIDRHYDRCGEGLGCVQTEARGWRCRKLCAIRQRNGCGDELCVLPTQVTGTGYCTPADGCAPVFPQSKCGKDDQGHQLNCYVLADDKGGGAFCLRPQAYGDSSGLLDSACERAVNCQAGFGCVTANGQSTVCRPYCDLPAVPDGGMASKVLCSGMLGTCQPIVGYEQVGRCY